MLSRRHFLAAAAALPLVGCRPDPNAPVLSSADANRIAAEKAVRDAHLAALAAGKVATTAKFTTPPRPVDLLKAFPELKPLMRMTVRLHPRYSDEPAADQSKLGGAFLWPGDEPWPVCEVFNIPYQPVLQLLADDTPSQVKFKPGSDVLQLLWSPREHDRLGGPKPVVVWRNRKEVSPPFADPPPTANAFPGYIPVPVRFFPEQVLEYPDWHTAKVTPLRGKVEAWPPPGGGDPVAEYERLSVAPGTKVGGYPRWEGTPNPPSCDTCHRGMDFLLTLDADEWREASWIPVEEAGKPELRATAANAAGLTLTGGNYHLFVCRRCPDWPVRGV
jgi:hypothetical protein